MTDSQGAAKAAPNVKQEVGYVGARLREKSTYAGLTVALGIAMPYLIHFVPALAHTNVDTIVSAICDIGIGIGIFIGVFLPENGSTSTTVPYNDIAKAVIAFLVIATAALLMAANRPATAQAREPIQLQNGKPPALPLPIPLPGQQPSTTSTGAAANNNCDFNTFTIITPQNVVATLQACGQKLLTDTQAALTSANKANDTIATACLTPSVALIQAAVGTPAVPAQPATASAPAVAAQPATLPGPVLVFQKFREFVDAGGITNCKAWVTNTVSAATTSGL
jgi:hypothetical protein